MYHIEEVSLADRFNESFVCHLSTLKSLQRREM